MMFQLVNNKNYIAGLLMISLVFSCSEQKNSPAPTSDFKGKIARNYKEAKEAWEDIPTPKKGTPNVVIFLLDDKT